MYDTLYGIIEKVQSRSFSAFLSFTNDNGGEAEEEISYPEKKERETLNKNERYWNGVPLVI